MRVVALVAVAFVLLSCTASPPLSVVTTATVAPTNTPNVVPPTSPPSPVVVAAEAAAWSRVTSATQSSIAKPTWLPPSIDRTSVEVRELVAAPNDARYTVVYRTTQGGAVVFALGPVDEIPGSGMGIVVRGQDATLTFPSSVFTDPSRPATRRIRWKEGGTVVLSITSDVFTGDDLLRIAWNLDPFTAPPPKNVFSRTNGACGAASPDDTARKLVSLIGRRDVGGMADCFSEEFLGRSGMGTPSGWADLPTATLDAVSQRLPLGGRPVVQVSWTFASDPGGAWNQKQTMFFTLGLDHERYRIYAMGTAGGGPAP